MHFIELDGQLINLDKISNVFEHWDGHSTCFACGEDVIEIDMPYEQIRDHILSWQRREAK